jgi:hypothetical protein
MFRRIAAGHTTSEIAQKLCELATLTTHKQDA